MITAPDYLDNCGTTWDPPSMCTDCDSSYTALPSGQCGGSYTTPSLAWYIVVALPLYKHIYYSSILH